MSVRTLLLGLAACATAAPALAATTTKTHSMAMKHTMATHASMSHKGHMMMMHGGHGSTASADNSADQLNARSLQNAQGAGMAAPAMPAPAMAAPAMPAPAMPAPAGGGT